jgi:hypothetical protein
MEPDYNFLEWVGLMTLSIGGIILWAKFHTACEESRRITRKCPRCGKPAVMHREYGSSRKMFCENRHFWDPYNPSKNNVLPDPKPPKRMIGFNTPIEP